jgi:hypothetical protein
MPLKVSVGLSKKIGQPDYGSLGASCHVEYEADSTLLNSDLEGFQRQVKNAFIACKQAVQDELHRHQASDQSNQPSHNGNGHSAANSNGNGNAHSTANSNGNGNGRTQRRSTGRKATVSQVRALNAIADRLQLSLTDWLYQKYGLRVPAELTIREASSAIDELNDSPAESQNGGH